MCTRIITIVLVLLVCMPVSSTIDLKEKIIYQACKIYKGFFYKIISVNQTATFFLLLYLESDFIGSLPYGS